MPEINSTSWCDDAQNHIYNFLKDRFGQSNLDDIDERFRRLCEEIGELANVLDKSLDFTVDHVTYGYNKKQGSIEAELAGVNLTLNTLCSSLNLSLDYCTRKDIERMRKLPLDYFKDKQNKVLEDDKGV